MTEEFPQDRQVWLRAFYGFSPEETGYIGFTREADRTTMLERMRDGDLVLVYGAEEDLTDPEQQSQALGFLEVTRESCTDKERSTPSALEWKVSHDFGDRWTFGIRVRRAWRIKNRVGIKTVAPRAFQNSERFERTTRALLLTAEEREIALRHPVYQVNVFGEEPIPQSELAHGVMDSILKPSRGIPPTFGPRTSVHEDGENFLYLMHLVGDAEALLGRTGKHVGQTLLKIGRSNDPARRLDEINSGFPEAAVIRWRLVAQQPFADGDTAHRYETELKELFNARFTSQGGEFFTASPKEADQEFTNFCASKLHRILGAAAKAGGVR